MSHHFPQKLNALASPGWRTANSWPYHDDFVFGEIFEKVPLSHRLGIAGKSVSLLPILAAVKAGNIEAAAYEPQVRSPASMERTSRANSRGKASIFVPSTVLGFR